MAAALRGGEAEAALRGGPQRVRASCRVPKEEEWTDGRTGGMWWRAEREPEGGEMPLRTGSHWRRDTAL